MSEYHAGTGDIKRLSRHEPVTPPDTEEKWWIPPVGEKGTPHLFIFLGVMLTVETLAQAFFKWVGI